VEDLRSLPRSHRTKAARGKQAPEPFLLFGRRVTYPTPHWEVIISQYVRHLQRCWAFKTFPGLYFASWLILLLAGAFLFLPP
jgi:hypothetical protein